MNSSNNSLSKKIKMAQLSQASYQIVIGNQELQEERIEVRSREGVRFGKLSLEDILEEFNSKLPHRRDLPLTWI
jgi:threonyl-tRNA synthetase